MRGRSPSSIRVFARARIVHIDHQAASGYVHAGHSIKTRLDEGGLTGRITSDTTFPDGDFRNSFFGGDRKAQVKHHVDALVADLGIEADQIAEVALRYVLSRDAVSTVIAGMRTVRNVERNAAVGDGRGLSAAQQAIVARHRWERNFYSS